MWGEGRGGVEGGLLSVISCVDHGLSSVSV